MYFLHMSRITKHLHAGGGRTASSKVWLACTCRGPRIDDQHHASRSLALDLRGYIFIHVLSCSATNWTRINGSFKSCYELRPVDGDGYFSTGDSVKAKGPPTIAQGLVFLLNFLEQLRTNSKMMENPNSCSRTIRTLATLALTWPHWLLVAILRLLSFPSPRWDPCQHKYLHAWSQPLEETPCTIEVMVPRTKEGAALTCKGPSLELQTSKASNVGQYMFRTVSCSQIRPRWEAKSCDEPVFSII